MLKTLISYIVVTAGLATMALCSGSAAVIEHTTKTLGAY